MTQRLPNVPRTLLGEDSLALLLENQPAPAAARIAPEQAAVRTAPPAQRSAPKQTPAAEKAPTVQVPYGPVIVAATDGSCRGNPGPGGWCWYIGTNSWASGGDKHTTNNVMELMAVREVLSATQEHRAQTLLLKVDSRYVIDALTKWIHGWRKNGWRTGAGKDVANKELIQEIAALMQGRDVQFEWVRGHNGNAMNEAADTRCCAAADAAKVGPAGRYGPGFNL